MPQQQFDLSGLDYDTILGGDGGKFAPNLENFDYGKALARPESEDQSKEGAFLSSLNQPFTTAFSRGTKKITDSYRDRSSVFSPYIPDRLEDLSLAGWDFLGGVADQQTSPINLGITALDLASLGTATPFTAGLRTAGQVSRPTINAIRGAAKFSNALPIAHGLSNVWSGEGLREKAAGGLEALFGYLGWRGNKFLPKDMPDVPSPTITPPVGDDAAELAAEVERVLAAENAKRAPSAPVANAAPKSETEQLFEAALAERRKLGLEPPATTQPTPAPPIAPVRPEAPPLPPRQLHMPFRGNANMGPTPEPPPLWDDIIDRGDVPSPQVEVPINEPVPDTVRQLDQPQQLPLDLDPAQWHSRPFFDPNVPTNPMSDVIPTPGLTGPPDPNFTIGPPPTQPLASVQGPQTVIPPMRPGLPPEFSPDMLAGSQPIEGGTSSFFTPRGETPIQPANWMPDRPPMAEPDFPAVPPNQAMREPQVGDTQVVNDFYAGEADWPSTTWRQQLEELDAIGAPDEAYNAITRGQALPGESARDRVLRFIELDRAGRADIASDESILREIFRQENRPIVAPEGQPFDEWIAEDVGGGVPEVRTRNSMDDEWGVTTDPQEAFNNRAGTAQNAVAGRMRREFNPPPTPHPDQDLIDLLRFEMQKNWDMGADDAVTRQMDFESLLDDMRLDKAKYAGRSSAAPKSLPEVRTRSSMEGPLEIKRTPTGEYDMADPVTARIVTMARNNRAAKFSEKVSPQVEIKPPAPPKPRDYAQEAVEKQMRRDKRLGDKPEEPPKTFWEKSRKEQTLDTAGVPRAIQSSYDLSMPFRQGLGLIHTKGWWKSWGGMLRSWGSDEAYKGVIEAVQGSPNYDLARSLGLDITGLGKIREEGFASQLADKIPLVTRSNRSASAFMNKLRMDTFDSLMMAAEKGGLNPRQNENLMHAMVDYINSASGRGRFNSKRIEKSMDVLNQLLFSPRLIKARADVLNPMNYTMVDPFIRKQYLKSLTSLGIGYLTFAGLAKAAGADVGPLKDIKLDDWTSSDFGRIRWGNTRIDPTGGMLPYVNLASRLLQGGKEFAEGTQQSRYGGRVVDPTPFSDIGEFAFNKAAPIPRFVMNAGRAQQWRPFYLGDEAARMVTPIIIQDLMEVAKDDMDWAKLVGIGGMSLVGIGTNTYEPGKPSRMLPDWILPDASDRRFPAMTPQMQRRMEIMRRRQGQ